LESALSNNPTQSVAKLEALINALRDDDGGCPWDRQQTADTIIKYLIEEAYELADAVISENADAVCEETGDVLFQLLFLVHLYRETGKFGFPDVIDKNVKKMVGRHPHVFGDATADTPEKVSQNWEKIKQKEKGDIGRRSALDAIPKNMSALARAALVSERAAKTGFDWDDISGVMDKTMEEWLEFTREVNTSGKPPDRQKIEMEFGDILFTMVNVARFARIHPETALTRSIQKFERRFGCMEKTAAAEGKAFSSLSVKEMHQLWDASKIMVG
jgi:tetrapyrrole methylase family protein/MazG family protein